MAWYFASLLLGQVMIHNPLEFLADILTRSEEYKWGMVSAQEPEIDVID